MRSSLFLKKALITVVFGISALSAADRVAFAQVGSLIPSPPKNAFYCDPVRGSMKGNGSKAKPWGRFQDVIAANLINGQDPTKGVIHAGDIVYLMSGNHGIWSMTPYSGQFANTDFITVQAFPGNTPIVQSVTLMDSSKWVFRGLTITNPPVLDQYASLLLLTRVKNVIADQNRIFSAPDLTNYTTNDWINKVADYGITVDGIGVQAVTLSNNSIYNIRSGMGLAGDNILVQGNSIDYFCDDGIDFAASNLVIRRNSITNHYGQVQDSLHADGMQGTESFGEVNNNVLIDSNIVLASTGKYAAIPPLVPGLGQDGFQGIGAFDGLWNNVVVTNNVVGSTAYDGMTWFGISNSVLANNTLITQSSSPVITTWLSVWSSKVGLPPKNVIVRNNIANRFSLYPGVTHDHNLSLSSNQTNFLPTEFIVTDPTKIFVLYNPSQAKFDLRLIGGSPAIGAGTSQSAPRLDILGNVRNQAKIDLGAFSYTGQ